MKDLRYVYEKIKKKYLDVISSLLEDRDIEQEKDIKTTSVIIFLSGIDKILSISMLFLWMSGKLKVDELVYKNRRELESGSIFCDYGLGAKAKIMEEYGIELKKYKWLSDLRNRYIYGHNLKMGYQAEPDFKKGELNLKSVFEIHFSDTFNVDVSYEDFDNWFDEIIKEICIELGKMKFEERYEKIKKRIQQLPENPKPFFSRINNEDASAEIIDEFEIKNNEIEMLNRSCIKEILKEFGLLK